MGRDAGGWQAACKLKWCIDLTIFLPEQPFDKEVFLGELKTILEKNKAYIRNLSEGARYADGTYLIS